MVDGNAAPWHQRIVTYGLAILNEEILAGRETLADPVHNIAAVRAAGVMTNGFDEIF
jgi:hypothetical protein